MSRAAPNRHPNKGMSPVATSTLAVAVAGVWMWLAMLLTHELGHVVAASPTGGVITSLELRPGWLPHTLVQPNPRPGVVLWGGFLAGWIVPQLTAPAWGIQAAFVGPMLRAWAAFCLLAGGVYLAVGGVERFTDTGQLLAAGWPHGPLVVAGAAVAAVGYMRSRSAWIAVARRLETTSFSTQAIAGWWSLLIAWIAGQGVLHFVLQPSQ